jgi:hypothetical protein
MHQHHLCVRISQGVRRYGISGKCTDLPKRGLLGGYRGVGDSNLTFVPEWLGSQETIKDSRRSVSVSGSVTV